MLYPALYVGMIEKLESTRSAGRDRFGLYWLFRIS